MFAILKARDSFICIFLMISSLARHIIKGFASEGWMFYVGELLFAHMGRLVDNPVKPLPENSHLLNKWKYHFPSRHTVGFVEIQLLCLC